MLGGPLAGTAVTALEGIFGVAPGSGASAVLNAVQTAGMTPQQVADLKVAELKHAEIIGQQGIDLQKMNLDFQTTMAQTDAADRISARSREVAVKDSTPKVLAYGIIGANLALIGCLAAGMIKSTDSAVFGLVGTALGYLVSESKAVLAYYFGSTRGSQSKDEMLFNSTPAKRNGNP